MSMNIADIAVPCQEDAAEMLSALAWKITGHMEDVVTADELIRNGSVETSGTKAARALTRDGFSPERVFDVMRQRLISEICMVPLAAYLFIGDEIDADDDEFDSGMHILRCITEDSERMAGIIDRYEEFEENRNGFLR